jgi:bifunctional non-homologous end joining protein LigD
MLATAAGQLPTDPGWAYEFKWDGVRVLVDVRDGRVRLSSRAGNDVTAAYPEVVALAGAAEDALVDGEIVALADGRPSFNALQARMHLRDPADVRRLAAEAPVTLVAFDLLRRYGVDLTPRPWSERRATLDRFAVDHPDWTVSPAFDDGVATESAAREHGLEGVMAKRRGSPYRPGVRSPDWLKLRFQRTGDFVVIGFEGPVGSRTLSSLVLAVAEDDGRLRFAGKAGSGLDGRTCAALQRRLEPVARCPVDPPPPKSPGRATSWVLPELVVEVRFSGWTPDGRLWQPVFRRLREDKSVREAAGDA